MKTVNGSTTIKLSPFQETISLIYDVDNKDLISIEQESILLYYLSDIQYLILKRNIEYSLNHLLSDEEFNTILNRNSLPIKEISSSVLTPDDFRKINYDLNYLSKYNELFFHLDGSQELLSTLSKVFAGDLSPIIQSSEFLNNVKKHQILVKLGIEKHLKTLNKSLDEKLKEHRLEMKRKQEVYSNRISATITKSRMK